MKVAFLTNSITKTSIPHTWKNLFNKDYDIEVTSFTFKNFKLGDIERLSKCDLVHGHHIKIMAVYILLNYFFGKPIIYTVHGAYSQLSAMNKFLFSLICKHSDYIVFVNQFLVDELPNRLKLSIKKKSEVVLNGIDISPKYQKVDINQKYHIPFGYKLIFHPARFVKEKNHEVVLEAFKNFSTDKTDAILVFAGDGPLRLSIEKAADKLGLERSVYFIGTIDRNDVYNFLAESDLFIMPSVSEGLNIAFLEALTMDIKILVSEIEQFQHPFKFYNLDPALFNVSFANPNSAADIRDNLKLAFESKHLPRPSLNRFDINEMVGKYITIYRKLLNEFS